ncbi:hypothetical protein NCAS_0B07440 [Naumovozyma castellii]|uniref:Large ribosomal subunit protein mL54 n=1 Tax=Naumovozyma castellii TaxID=27288 RepID=G0VA98_NAUCA|nr:hypothetical protein NCAS_0B07440 [Naumovozyma castellii CBS 4309]CCC68828.1 hypothetical protein NCAS_0B07440 [Naumovozyma castellii CBS 4309]
MLRLVFKRSLSTSFRVLTAEAATTANASTNIKSSCLAGTSLNLNIKKNGKDPIALEDNEYPAWLWKVLESKAPKEASDLSEQEVLAMRKKQLRKENRKKIKQNNFLSQLK